LRFCECNFCSLILLKKNNFNMRWLLIGFAARLVSASVEKIVRPPTQPTSDGDKLLTFQEATRYVERNPFMKTSGFNSLKTLLFSHENVQRNL